MPRCGGPRVPSASVTSTASCCVDPYSPWNVAGEPSHRVLSPSDAIFTASLLTPTSCADPTRTPANCPVTDALPEPTPASRLPFTATTLGAPD